MLQARALGRSTPRSRQDKSSRYSPCSGPVPQRDEAIIRISRCGTVCALGGIACRVPWRRDGVPVEVARPPPDREHPSRPMAITPHAAAAAPCQTARAGPGVGARSIATGRPWSHRSLVVRSRDWGVRRTRRGRRSPTGRTPRGPRGRCARPPGMRGRRTDRRPRRSTGWAGTARRSGPRTKGAPGPGCAPRRPHPGRRTPRRTDG